ncbi:MAG: hypothetical protein VW683_00555 [Betaproteobacteria bacterium]|jgi:hypothetical protein
MIFRAWYTENRIFDGTSVEDWKSLPSEGVLFVSLFYPTGVTFYNGADWYYINDQGNFAHVLSGEWGTEQPAPVSCIDCIKKGVGVSDEEYANIEQQALNTNSI